MSYSRKLVDYVFEQASVTVRGPARVALSHIRAGEIGRAISVLNVAVEKNANDAKLLELLGVIQYEYGDAFQGVASLEKALTLAACNETTLCNAAHVFRTMGECSRALELYQQALELEPAYAEAYSGMGNIFLEEGDCERAYELYAIALTYAPINASYYNNRSVAARKLGMLEQALLDAEQACQLSPLNLHWINLADAYVATENMLGCKRILEKLSNVGFDTNYYTVLGKLHFKNGDLTDSIQSFQKAIELNASNLDAYEECAAAYYTVGDSKAAQYCIRQCLDHKMDSLRYRYLDCLYTIPIRESSREAGVLVQQHFINKVDSLKKWLDKTPKSLSALIAVNFVSPLFFLYNSELTQQALRKYNELLSISKKIEAFNQTERSDVICIVTSKADDAEYNAQCLSHLLRELDASGHEIFLMGIVKKFASESSGMLKTAVVSNSEDALDLLKKIKPKAIIYTDLGSNYLSYALAQTRLAPLQLQTWNSACGFLSDAIDGVLMPDFQSGLNCSNIPREKIYFYKDQLAGLSAGPTISQGLSVDAGEKFLLCDASALKYQGEYIEVLLDLLQANNTLRLLVASDFGYSSLNLKNEMLACAARKGFNGLDRLIFRPGGFLALLGGVPAGQAIVLDSFPYSDFASVYSALMMNIPVVTMSGPELHGQIGAQLLRVMGLDAMLVSKNMAESAELCQRLVADSDFYALVCLKIAAAKESLPFGDGVLASSTFLGLLDGCKG